MAAGDGEVALSAFCSLDFYLTTSDTPLYGTRGRRGQIDRVFSPLAHPRDPIAACREPRVRVLRPRLPLRVSHDFTVGRRVTTVKNGVAHRFIALVLLRRRAWGGARRVVVDHALATMHHTHGRRGQSSPADWLRAGWTLVPGSGSGVIVIRDQHRPVHCRGRPPTQRRHQRSIGQFEDPH